LGVGALVPAFDCARARCMRALGAAFAEIALALQ